MRTYSNTVTAILLMLASMVCFALMSSTIRLLAGELHSTQTVLMRNVLSLIIVVIWTALFTKRRPQFKTERMVGHFWRASVGIVAMQLWFYALTLMPVTLATALSFTTPIFATIVAILFLGEKAGIRRWSAIVVGFIGMWVILRPDVGGLNHAAIIVLASSFIMAIAGALVKTLTNTESPETIVFYMALFMSFWSLPLGMLHWQAINAYEAWLLFVIALSSTAAHLMMARAYKRVEMVVLMPFDFTRLIFTAIFAYFLFGETLDAHTLTGSLIIVASTVYIAYRESRKKKEITVG